MPELPEVERATQLLKEHAVGKTITNVQTEEDTIVYSGVSHSEFASEIVGRGVRNVARYGKVFYIELDGDGRMPVLHFGMTGNIQIKGHVPLTYRENGRAKKDAGQWPPRFKKFIISLKSDDSSEVIEVAFMDARRLARIRLCLNPLKEPPISNLGFDPLLSMISLEEFSSTVAKRTCPIKALLLDQSFSAGVGNWVADEVLYHARIHPEERCNVLTDEQISTLHVQIVTVCRTATELNADAAKFPENWLFQHRWGKGKGQKKTLLNGLKLPSGELATIKWLTVGGRTSAYVVELQKLNGMRRRDKTRRIGAKESMDQEGSESDLTALSDEMDSDEFTAAPVKRTTRSSTSSEAPNKKAKRC